MSASDGGGAETIQVVCRLRPLSKREAGSASVLEVQDDARTVALKGASVKDFTYDRVFGPDTAQSELFEAVGRPLTEACAAGFHGTVFAYGQTGSGKTHTILGEGNGDEAGLLPRVLRHLFATTSQRTGQAEKGSKVSYTTKCSFLEIYNERIIDLLDAASTNLALREDSDKGVYVDGLTEEEVACPEDALALMKRGARNRHIGATAMNRHSSRSHSVFTLRIECRETEASGLTKTRHARFNLIDLAGSERQKGTGAEGARLREASNINKSLSELGNVIQALAAVSSGRSVAHVPYRNSKLTFLLRDSLGGNSKTFLVATVSPAEEAFGETLSTLKFASRAKLVKNQAVVNEDTAGSFALLQAEVRRLQAALAEARTAITSGGAAADGTAHAQGACTPAALAVAAVAPSLAKMEALFQALAASHRAASRAGAGDAGASPDHTSLPAGLALELLAKAHADATDTGLPPLGSLSAAASAAAELAAARATAAAASAAAAASESRVQELTSALEQYSELVHRLEEVRAAQNLRLKLREAALARAQGQGGDLVLTPPEAAEEISALQKLVCCNPEAVRLRMLIDDLAEVDAPLALAEPTAEEGEEEDTVVQSTSALPLPSTLTYTPTAVARLWAARHEGASPQAALADSMDAALAELDALRRERAALSAALARHEVGWENPEAARAEAEAARSAKMQQWREEQDFAGRLAAATAQAEAAAAEAKAATARAEKAEAAAAEASVRLDAGDLTIARLRRELGLAHQAKADTAAAAEAEAGSAQETLLVSEGRIADLSRQLAALQVQLSEAHAAGEEAACLAERADAERAEAEAALAAVRGDLDLARDEVSTLQGALEEAESEAKSSAALLADAHAALDKAEKGRKAALHKAQRATFQLESAVEDAETNMEASRKFQATCADLRRQLSEAEAAAAAADQRAVVAEAEAAAAKRAAAEADSTASSSADEAHAATLRVQQELRKAQADLAASKGAAEAEAAAASTLRRELAAEQQVAADLHRQLQEAEMAAAELTTNLIEARGALKAASGRAEAAERTVSAAHAEAAAARTDLERVRAEAAAARTASEAELGEVMEALESAKVTAAAAEKRAAEADAAASTAAADAAAAKERADAAEGAAAAADALADAAAAAAEEAAGRATLAEAGQREAEAAAAAATGRAQAAQAEAKTRVEEVKGQLEAAQRRIAELEPQAQALAELRATLQGAAPGTPVDEAAAEGDAAGTAGADTPAGEVLALLQQRDEALRASRSDAASLRASLVQAQSQLADAQSATGTLTVDLKEARDAAAEAAAVASTTQAALEAQVEALSADLRVASSRVEELSAQLEETAARAAEASSSEAKHSSLVERLEAMVAQRNAKLEAALARAGEAEAALARAQATSQATASVNATATGRVAKLEVEGEKTRQALCAAQASLRVLRGERDAATVQAAAAEREVADLRSALRAARAEAAAATTAGAGSQQTATGAHAAVAAVAAELSTARSAVGELSAAILVLAEQLQDAKLALTARGRVAATVRLKTKLAEAKATIAALTEGRPVPTPSTPPTELRQREQAVARLQGDVTTLTAAVQSAVQALGLPERAPPGSPVPTSPAAAAATSPSRTSTSHGAELADLPAALQAIQEAAADGCAPLAELTLSGATAMTGGAAPSSASSMSVPAATAALHRIVGAAKAWAQQAQAVPPPAPPQQRKPLGALSAPNTPARTPGRKGVQGLTYTPGGGLLKPVGVSSPEWVQWAGQHVHSGPDAEGGFFL